VELWISGNRAGRISRYEEEKRAIREHDMLPFEQFPVLSMCFLGFSPHLSATLVAILQISKMPEHREIKRTGLTDLSGGGFFIRRVASPGGLAGRRTGKPLSRRFPSPFSNKENVPPVWAVKATPARRRSSLPDWYPRTPLRDITAIAKVMDSFFSSVTLF
jgi:hypothetical protein